MRGKVASFTLLIVGACFAIGTGFAGWAIANAAYAGVEGDIFGDGNVVINTETVNCFRNLSASENFTWHQTAGLLTSNAQNGEYGMRGSINCNFTFLPFNGAMAIKSLRENDKCKISFSVSAGEYDFSSDGAATVTFSVPTSWELVNSDNHSAAYLVSVSANTTSVSYSVRLDLACDSSTYSLLYENKPLTLFLSLGEAE